MSQEELSIEEIRTLVIDALRDFHTGKSDFASNLQTVTLWHQVGRVTIQKGLKDGSIVSGNDWGKVLSQKENKRIGEVITNLFSEGVLMWKLDPRTSSGAPFMDITEYGEQVIESEEITPHDPDGFLKLYKEEVPEANQLVEKYLVESIQTYRTNNIISSAVMLGVSAEGIFDDLFYSIKKSLTEPKRIKKFDDLEKKAGLKEKFEEVMKQVRLIKQFLNKPLDENIESHVNGIFELIRVQRNDSAHPNIKDVPRTDLFVSMRLFREYSKSTYAVKKWFDKNYGWEGKLKESKQ